MLFSLLYMVLRAVFRLAPAGDQRDRELEILVLRHQVKVLKRKVGRPKLKRRDRLFLAAAANQCASSSTTGTSSSRARVLASCARHHNAERPHRGIELRVPEKQSHVDPVEIAPESKRRGLLGGLIHEYHPVAA